MTDLEFHPLAQHFPLMAGDEYRQLVEDIAAHGLREPIVVHEEMILDGRNRHRACLEAGVEPRTTVYDGDEPLAYVVSVNLHRRHLTTSQRAMIAAKMANMKSGTRTDLEPSANWPEVPISKAAERLNVGERSVIRARKVLAEASPAIVEAVRTGDISVSKAALELRQKTLALQKAKGSRKGDKRKGDKTSPRPGQIENARLWSALREGLWELNGLPKVETMVRLVPASQREMVSRQLPGVVQWLGAFMKACNQTWSNNHDRESHQDVEPQE